MDQVSRNIPSGNFLLQICFSILDTPLQADQHVLLAQHREVARSQAFARLEVAQRHALGEALGAQH